MYVGQIDVGQLNLGQTRIQTGVDQTLESSIFLPKLFKVQHNSTILFFPLILTAF
jgi:hypothetical protein